MSTDILTNIDQLLSQPATVVLCTSLCELCDVKISISQSAVSKYYKENSNKVHIVYTVSGIRRDINNAATLQIILSTDRELPQLKQKFEIITSIQPYALLTLDINISSPSEVYNALHLAQTAKTSQAVAGIITHKEQNECYNKYGLVTPQGLKRSVKSSTISSTLKKASSNQFETSKQLALEGSSILTKTTLVANNNDNSNISNQQPKTKSFVQHKNTLSLTSKQTTTTNSNNNDLFCDGTDDDDEWTHSISTKNKKRLKFPSSNKQTSKSSNEIDSSFSPTPTAMQDTPSITIQTPLQNSKNINNNTSAKNLLLEHEEEILKEKQQMMSNPRAKLIVHDDDDDEGDGFRADGSSSDDEEKHRIIGKAKPNVQDSNTSDRRIIDSDDDSAYEAFLQSKNTQPVKKNDSPIKHSSSCGTISKGEYDEMVQSSNSEQKKTNSILTSSSSRKTPLTKEEIIARDPDLRMNPQTGECEKKCIKLIPSTSIDEDGFEVTTTQQQVVWEKYLFPEVVSSQPSKINVVQDSTNTTAKKKPAVTGNKNILSFFGKK